MTIYTKLFTPSDLLKTIVSLSSGSIVLSVTFSSSLRALKLGPHWSKLIVLSFVLLALSLIIALVALWVGTRVYGIQSSVFDARLEIRRAFMAATSDDECLNALKEIHRRAIQPVEATDKLVARLVPISSVAFCIAIICLAVVGAKQIIS